MGAFDALRIGQIDNGFWGDHTSSIDWCELNYTHSPYIAEFFNTLSNLPSVLLGIYGALATSSAGVPKRYALGYLGLTLIGLGSTGFHASLRWEWQLMDELPMIYVVSYAGYMVLDTLPGFKPRFGIWGPITLVAWDIFVTFSYLYMPNPIYHQIAFAFILLTTVGRNIYLIQRLPDNHWAKPAVKRTMFKGVVTFALAFVIWNIDNICCDQLRKARERLGVWGFVLEGHAYWHFGTGYGTFLITAAAFYLELAIKTSPDAYTFNPNDWFPIPRPTLPPHSQTPPRRESDAKKDSRPTSEESKEPAGKVAPGKVPNEKDTVKK